MKSAGVHDDTTLLLGLDGVVVDRVELGWCSWPPPPMSRREATVLLPGEPEPVPACSPEERSWAGGLALRSLGRLVIG